MMSQFRAGAMKNAQADGRTRAGFLDRPPEAGGAADSRIRTIVAGFRGSVVGEAVLGPAVWLRIRRLDVSTSQTRAKPDSAH